MHYTVNKPELQAECPQTPTHSYSSTIQMGAEKRYSSIPTIRREMAAHNLPEPVFENRRNEFVVTLYNQILETPVHAFDPIGTLLDFCKEPRSRKEIASFLVLKTASYATERYIRSLLEEGKLEMTIPDKPKSTLQEDRTVHKAQLKGACCKLTLSKEGHYGSMKLV